MDCPKCYGMMVQDLLYDALESRNGLQSKAWRCVICGNVIDPVVLKNRSKQGAEPVHA